MKRILLVLALVLSSMTIFSQSQKYNDLKTLYRGYGYSIGTEQVVTLTQGQLGYTYVNFHAGYVYSIVAMSDDSDVLDVDVFTYYPSGYLFMKDSDSSNLAIVSFECSGSSQLKIVVKNYSSLTPTYSYTFRYFVAYK
jgi:hypothetical protein